MHLETHGWQPHFRVLLLAVPSVALLRRLAMAVPQGALVAMGTGDEVYEARRQLADLPWVMIHPWDGQENPWRPGHFDITVPAEVLQGQ